MKRTLTVQFSVFISLFFLLEIGLQFSGLKPGTLVDEFCPPLDTVVNLELFRADEQGITSYNANAHLPIEYKVNKQGFLSDFDFNEYSADSLKKLNKKTVFLIGDSYTEGCCAFPLDSSFADLLCADSGFVAINFGIGNTDLVQYKLIIEKYVPIFNPDLVVVFFYLGNDIAYYERPVLKNVPYSFTIKDWRWLNAVPPVCFSPDYPNFYLKTPQEAYSFYLKNYTLYTENLTLIERLIRNSIILSKIYLGVREKYYQLKWELNYGFKNQNIITTNRLVNSIVESGERAGSKVIVMAIPSPVDINEVDLKSHYEAFLGNRSIFPDIESFSEEHYDGKEIKNHFNNAGHRMYYRFAKKNIERELK